MIKLAAQYREDSGMVHLDINMENEESYSLPYTMQKST